MSQQDPVVIVAAKRTPMGGFQGALSSLSVSELGASAVGAAVLGSSKNLLPKKSFFSPRYAKVPEAGASLV